ncbi:hypothetical protein MYX84_11145, partial [Acidobacteria bacterium AH-259-O06]|nr:hypothetical protein [Acidobacteria bacterium AH-259-O06]
MSLPGFTLILSFLFAPTIVSSPLPAQADKPPQRIEEIRIIGNRRVPESTIRYYLQSKEEDAYNEQQILRDYR